jgi:hypothetical protein
MGESAHLHWGYCKPVVGNKHSTGKELLFCFYYSSYLTQIRELLVYKLEPIDFLNYCCPWVLPSLLIYNSDKELKWLAKVTLNWTEPSCHLE